MEQLYACGISLGICVTTVGIFMSGYSVGQTDGKPAGEFEMRPKVVVYCIEKPDLCKEEYNTIKTQLKLNNYQLPEIK